MQVDVGFGDVITHAPTLIDYPVLLGMPVPRLRAYPVETAIAEKLQAMVFLGELNSRMKDFLDIWLLCRHTTLDPVLLQKAISATFAHRRTDIPTNPVCFSKEFAKAKQAQWTAMLRKNPIHSVPPDFASTLEEIQAVVMPIFSRLTRTRKRGDGV